MISITAGAPGEVKLTVRIDSVELTPTMTVTVIRAGLAEEAAVEADAPDAEAAAIVELEPAPVEPAESKASAQARRGSAVEQIIPPPPAVDSAATVAPPASAAPATSSEQPMENKATEEAPAENVA